jgi:hypothetical protein
MVDSASNPRRRWFQFGIGAVLVVTAIVALLLSNAVSLRRAHLAEQEVRTLRHEAGYLTIDDPTQIYVRSIPTNESMNWQWRLHLPDGFRFSICSCVGKIPLRGFDHYGSSTPLKPGLQRILVSIRRNYTGECEWSVICDERSERSILSDAEVAWMPSKRFSIAQAGVDGDVHSPPEKPFELLRLNDLDSTNGAAPAGSPGDGILVWLTAEPVKPKDDSKVQKRR